MRQLEENSSKLKRLVTDFSLDMVTLPALLNREWNVTAQLEPADEGHLLATFTANPWNGVHIKRILRPSPRIQNGSSHRMLRS